MAQSDSQYTLIANPSAKRKFLQVIAFTGTSGFTSWNTTFPDGTPVPPHPWIVVQPDADAQWELNSAANAVTTTNSSWVQAGQFDLQAASLSDKGINVKGRTGSGNLMVFVQAVTNV